MTRLQRVVVDLTPVLPGGENGGAKPFALELVARMARLRPAIEFVLLTSWKSHDELASLDSLNVRRHLLIPKPAEVPPQAEFARRDASGHTPPISAFRRVIETRIAPAMPERIRTRLREPYEWLVNVPKPLLRELGAGLYFCPFTAPVNANPAVPCVSIVHDLQFATYPHLFGEADLRERGGNFRLACRTAQRLVCPSEYVKGTIADTGEADPRRVAVIPHSLQARLPGVREEEARAMLAGMGLNAGGYLLYPANFWKHKNHEMLLAALSLCRRRARGVDVRLVCTGEPGARRDELMRLADGMGLARWVVFPGYVAVDEFAALMRGARALVFPSLYEGFGIPVLEAMREGVPVACSDRTALPEVSGGAALLFDPRKPESVADAIGRLAEDDALLRELVEKGRKRVDGMAGADSMAERYLDLFDEVCR